MDLVSADEEGFIWNVVDQPGFAEKFPNLSNYFANVGSLLKNVDHDSQPISAS